jgi:hypothetical protein
LPVPIYKLCPIRDIINWLESTLEVPLNVVESRHHLWIVSIRNNREDSFAEATVEHFAVFTDAKRLQISNVENMPSMSLPEVVEEGSREGKAEPAVAGVRFAKIDGCARMHFASGLVRRLVAAVGKGPSA